MKKKGNVPRQYDLPNAKFLLHKAGPVQYYRGDFFVLIASQTTIAEVNETLRIKSWDVRYMYDLPTLRLELWMDATVVNEYAELKGSKALNELASHPSLEMERIVLSFFRTVPLGDFADRYIYACVVDLLLQLVIEVEERKVRPRTSGEVFALAEKAKDIIENDLSEYDTVQELASKLAVTKRELQYSFKKRYGVTVGEFSKKVRMDYAHRLLETTNDILLTIALAVGYNDTANFSIAFKNHFGYSPGTVHNKIKSGSVTDSQKPVPDS